MEGRWLALVVLTVTRASLGFQFQSVGSVAPLLIRDLGVSYADIGFLVGLYITLVHHCRLARREVADGLGPKPCQRHPGPAWNQRRRLKQPLLCKPLGCAEAHGSHLDPVRTACPRFEGRSQAWSYP